jgi:hypothetical protein
MNFGRSKVGLLAGLLVLSAAAPAAAQRGRLSSYDGSWSVVAAPEGGSCDRVQQFSFGIQNGVVSYNGSGGVQVSGRVSAKGGVHATLAYAGAQANVAGRLMANGRGSGRWSSSGSLTCMGRWSAQRA